MEESGNSMFLHLSSILPFEPTSSLSAADESKEAVAVAFYPTICSKFFPLSESSSAATVGVSLRSTVRIFTPMHYYIHPFCGCIMGNLCFFGTHLTFGP